MVNQRYYEGNGAAWCPHENLGSLMRCQSNRVSFYFEEGLGRQIAVN